MEETAQIELDILRDIAAKDGVETASVEAAARIEAGLAFLGEISSRSAIKQLVMALVGEVIAQARPPEYWSERFAAGGVRISARAIREKAFTTGAFYSVNKKVLIAPAHLDSLFVGRQRSSAQDAQPPRSSPPGRALAGRWRGCRRRSGRRSTRVRASSYERTRQQERTVTSELSRRSPGH